MRSLIATPAPTAAAILTLAVAVAVNLAMFGLIDRAIVSPARHVVDPSRVLTFGFQAGNQPGAGRMTTTSYPTFASIRDGVPAIAGAAAFQPSSMTVIVDGEQRSARAMIITTSYFDVLGVRPMLGAGFTADSDRAGAAPAVVLSHSWWHAAFGGDRRVIGRHLSVRGVDYVVAGVMPEGFSGHSSQAVDVWVPFAAAMSDSPGWDRNPYRNILSVVGRLADGQPAAAAEAQASAAIGRAVTLSPIAGANIAANERQIAWWLGGVSLLVFAIGLANAGTLLVVRAAKRRQEIAIRASLGASGGRLVGQGIAEALLLALMATAVSLLLAPLVDEMVRRVLFPGLAGESGLRGTTILTVAIAGVLAAIVATIANLWQLPPAFALRASAASRAPEGGRCPRQCDRVDAAGER
jgi:hypothetical protein